MTKANNSVHLVNQLTTTVETLVKQRMAWVSGTYAASNAELYAILGGTLDLMLKIKTSVTLGKGLNALLREKGIAFNESTSLAVKVVRLVFVEPGAEEQTKHRLFGYARVLTVAAENNVTGATLAQFIEQGGGIDEIRRKGKDGASKADRDRTLSEYAEVHLATRTEAPLVPSFEMPGLLQPADDMHFSLALVRKDSGGKGSIVFGTNNKTLVKQVLAIAGKAMHEEDDKRRLEAKTQEMEDVRAANVSQLKAELSQSAGIQHVSVPEYADFA